MWKKGIVSLTLLFVFVCFFWGQEKETTEWRESQESETTFFERKVFSKGGDSGEMKLFNQDKAIHDVKKGKVRKKHL